MYVYKIKSPFLEFHLLDVWGWNFFSCHRTVQIYNMWQYKYLQAGDDALLLYTDWIEFKDLFELQRYMGVSHVTQEN